MPTTEVEGDFSDDGDDEPIIAIDDRRERMGKNLFGIGEGVIVTDPLGRIILLNHVAESLTGWSDRDAKDQPIDAVFRIIHEVTRQPVAQSVKRVIDFGITQNLAQFTLLITKDGRERAIDDSAAPIRGEGGDLEGVVLIFKDISDRRRREKGLEENRLRGEVIIATLRDSLLVLDANIHVRMANQSFYEMFGTSAEQTIGQSFFDLDVGPFAVDRLRTALEKIVTGDRDFDDLLVEQTSTEIGARTLLLHARRLHRENKPEAMILLTIEDVSGQKQSQLSLEASELRYRRLFEAAQDGILILDNETGMITDANPFLLELLGYPLHELLDKQLHDLGLLEDKPACIAYMKILRSAGYVRYDDLPLKTSAGRPVEIEFVSNVYPVDDRLIIQCNIRDMTVRKLAEVELKRAKKEAEDANRTKDLFLATLSHELRTPLTPVLASVEYLETKAGLPDELREQIAMIRRNVELEARLIDDLLDVTRIGQGKLEVNREIISVHQSIRAALAFCQAEADAKKLEISIALRAEGHLVWADSARLQQVFWNLIRNAVKFTPAEGLISIRSADTGTGRIAIEVSDNGVGIEADALLRIFGVFEQGGRDVTRRHGGLGLGLAIAKMLIELHGGTLTARSPGKNQGSVFRVELDQNSRPPDEDPRPAPPTVPDIPPCKVLLVEDNGDTLRAIAQLLRSTGFTVRTATNVVEAMAALAIERFDLLVSDIGLPDGSGLDIMRYGRDTFGLKGIAFSGYATQEDMSVSKAAGFSFHLAKPTGHQILIELIRRTAS